MDESDRAGTKDKPVMATLEATPYRSPGLRIDVSVTEGTTSIVIEVENPTALIEPDLIRELFSNAIIAAQRFSEPPVRHEMRPIPGGAA